MNEFNPGDQIFIFGFSRGAYTARALCGLLKMCGLLTAGNEALIPYALRLYKSNDPCKFEIAAGFKSTFSVPCKPYFLGLWDTLSSVGWILDPIHTKGGHLPYTATLPDVPVIRHAVSIDERRAFFRQNLVHEPAAANQNDQAYAELKLSPERQKEWNGYRENELLAPLKYKARPHNGIWATPPYLHNGSVPNLFALLSPLSERPKVFYLATHHYHPFKLYLNTNPLPL